MRWQLTAVALLVALSSPAAEIVLVDGHTHAMIGTKDTDGSTITPQVQIARYQTAGLSGIVMISSSADTLRTYAALSSRTFVVYPFISVARKTGGGLELNDAVVQTIDDSLRSGTACGIGELPLRQAGDGVRGDDNPLNDPLLSRIYDIAAERGVPVMMHVQVKVEDADPFCQSGGTAKPSGGG